MNRLHKYYQEIGGNQLSGNGIVKNECSIKRFAARIIKENAYSN
jgi:hypothetical protein